LPQSGPFNRHDRLPLRIARPKSQPQLEIEDLRMRRQPPTVRKPDGRDHLVRHRTIRSKGCLSNKTALAMVFKLVDAAQKSWRRLDGHNQLPKLIQGVRFTDGIEVAANPTSSKSQIAAA
jgi:hypothetical protein